MSTSPGMAHMPFKAFRRSLLSIATGLRTGEQGVIGIFELAIENVSRNALRMIQTSSPVLGHLIATIVPFTMLGYGIYKWVYSGLETKEYIWKTFTVDVTVPGGTVLNTHLVDYMADHSGSTNTRSVTVLENHLTKVSVSPQSTSALKYIPKRATDGWFRFENRWLKFAQTLQTVEQTVNDGHDEHYRPRQRTRRVIQDSEDADVVISTFSLTGSIAVIQRFLEHVQRNHEVKINTKYVKPPTQIFRLANMSPDIRCAGPWALPIEKPARDMSSVTMEAEAKTSLLSDIKTYMESCLWYHNRGIGWRRGYLFYGPPGSGKTVTSTAIAGHFDLPLYIINFSDLITDSVLESAFKNLPDRCVVLMEDIDSAGIGRGKMTEKNDVRSAFRPDIFLQQGITLSGLLNTIDGPVAKEGRILIITSNTPDSLDPALVRPGRIDRKILFGFAGSEVIAKLFLHIFSDHDVDEEDSNLTLLSQEFASKVPVNKLTPAEIQGFLLVNRDDPDHAVRLAEAWADKLITTKSKGGNVARFNGQIGMIDAVHEDEIWQMPNLGA